MLSYQRMLFDWIAGEPPLTAVVLLAAGLLSGLYGVRMIRLLVAVYAAALGYAAGVVLFPWVGSELARGPLGAPIVGSVVATALGAAALAWPVPLIVLTSSVLWAGLGVYFSGQLGLPDVPSWIAAGLLGVSALVLTLVGRHTMIIFLTAFPGAGLFVVGLAGVGAAFIPSVGSTVCEWGSGRSVIIPILLIMLVVTAYSYQANDRAGELGLSSPEVPGARRRPAGSRG